MFNYSNNQLPMQMQCDKQLQVSLTQMKYKMDNIHKNTMNSIKETCGIVEHSTNEILIGNAMNKLGSIIFASNTFFQCLEREIQEQNLSENNKKILLLDYKQRINDYQTKNFDYLQMKSKLPGIFTYVHYYNDVLLRQFRKNPIDLVNIKAIINKEKDQEKLKTLLNNFNESTRINEKITKKIEKDPIKYTDINYENEKKKFNEKNMKAARR